MPTTLCRRKVRQLLDNFDFRNLFIQELGWDHGGSDIEVTVKDHIYFLQAVAQKRGFVVYLYHPQPGATFPDHPTRQQIERKVAKEVREHLIIFCPYDRSAQYWFWVKREPGWPERSRTHIYYSGQRGELLIQKLEKIIFTLDEEENVTIVDSSSRVRAAFDVEKVTKRFYERFKKEHQAFLGFIEGICNNADREWYASLMLNRMMFIYFIQKRRFLDDNPDYLRDRLHTVRQRHGTGRFDSFYRIFLLKLFHEGLGQPEAERDPELHSLLGQVPFLNGGLFDVHGLERDYPDIDIPDEAFEQVFEFFDAYQWHLDERFLRNDNEINPDVLGYIFEKYINQQQQMGAYYTKEDITSYISRNTIIPFLFDRAEKECPIAFELDGGVWRLLQEDPEGYFHDAVRHGITYDRCNKKVLEAKQELPPDIAIGLDNVAQRGGWNEPAPDAYALPTETWREHVARRRRYEEIYAKLEAGEVTSINDLITYNLNIEKFALDVIANSEGPELVRAFWKAIVNVSVLDPTCGSGAFLFAALNILEPLYSACLEAMNGFLDDLERSQRPHSPQALSDFRKVLAHVAKHASKEYFIFKSIVISNIYGVDIMEEAVEICKLRLFLKLVAQLETYDQIEPLPDIDFNVRAGNTLVGFASLKEVKRAIQGDWIKELALPDIEERAELADRAFRRFRSMQTDYGMDASGFAEAKLDLRERLDVLREELDRYLASEYGVSENDGKAYVEWRASHQPFHWFVEYYGIMHNCGFDVIIGNPPYVEYKKAKKDYKVRGYDTESCGDLYAFALERAMSLSSHNGWIGFIVPLSCFSVGRFLPLQKLYLHQANPLYVSNWSGDAHPSKLFEGVNKRLEIVLARRHTGKNETSVYSSKYLKWYAAERQSLFDLFPIYSAIPSLNQVAFFRSSVPKVDTDLELSVMSKLRKCKRHVSTLVSPTGQHKLYYTRKVSFFLQFLDFVPEVRDSRGELRPPSELKTLAFSNKNLRNLSLCSLSTSLFYWYNVINSDCRNLNKREIVSFPVPSSVPDSAQRILDQLLKRLMKCYLDNSTLRTVNYKGIGKVTVQYFNFRPAKPIVDEIDSVLSPHYGLTNEELDFIINYDIKYRMGR